MKVRVVSYSLSHDPSTLKEWKKKLFAEIDDSLSNEVDVILYPELFLLGLERYFDGSLLDKMKKVSHFVQTELLNSLDQMTAGKEVLLCLGSGPILRDGKFYNSSPVNVGGQWIWQDKIHLTPWEVDFTPGREIQIFKFKELVCAVSICYDVEQLTLAYKLKKEMINLLLVPSATFDVNGSQRVNRCASARSVELGAAVFTAPLVGDSSCELVDHSEGRQGFFLPSQSCIVQKQEIFSSYSSSDHLISIYDLDEGQLVKVKTVDDETKPFQKLEVESLTVIHK